MFCPLDYTGVTDMPKPNPWWTGGVLITLDLNSSMSMLATMGTMGIPWFHHEPVHNTYLGKGNKGISRQNSYNVMICCNGLRVLLCCCKSFSHFFNDGDGRVH